MSDVASGSKPTERPSDQEYSLASGAEGTRSSCDPSSHGQSHGHAPFRDHGLLRAPAETCHHRTGPCLCRVGKAFHHALCAGDHHGLCPIHGRLSGWSNGLRVLWRDSRGSTSMNRLPARVWMLLSYGEEIEIAASLLCLCVLVARRANLKMACQFLVRVVQSACRVVSKTHKVIPRATRL